MSLTRTSARDVVAQVVDPEIPVLTIEELGVLRDVVERDDGEVIVTITPTYSGCPAMRQIEDEISRALERAGFDDYRVETSFKPAWTTEWMTDGARKKLEDFGIAPPVAIEDVRCPQCRHGETRVVAQFGSTACKALMVCSSCGDPFDYFKAH